MMGIEAKTRQVERDHRAHTNCIVKGESYYENLGGLV